MDMTNELLKNIFLSLYNDEPATFSLNNYVILHKSSDISKRNLNVMNGKNRRNTKAEVFLTLILSCFTVMVIGLFIHYKIKRRQHIRQPIQGGISFKKQSANKLNTSDGCDFSDLNEADNLSVLHLQHNDSTINAMMNFIRESDKSNYAAKHWSNLKTNVDLRSDENNLEFSSYSIVDEINPTSSYIIAKTPSIHNIEQFWREVWKTRCTLIVHLACDQCKDINLAKTITMEKSLKELEINEICESKWDTDCIVKIVMLKCLKTMEIRIVSCYKFLLLPPQQFISDRDALCLLSFKNKVNTSYSKLLSPTWVISCDLINDGGMYLLVDFVFRRIESGELTEIDVPSTLADIRQQFPGLITSEKHFTYACWIIRQDIKNRFVCLSNWSNSDIV
ncbi:hypothetical protein GJ496_007304 [Pomphorhynchus laevis]|nr:hypothetical protein GJ496_007304 [Pomphorhynchus laevis]